MLHSPDQSETPRSLGSEWFLNTMEAKMSLGALSVAGTNPFVLLCFLSLSQLSMQWCCVLSHGYWFSLKASNRRPCHEPSSDPCRPQQMDASSLHACEHFELGSLYKVTVTTLQTFPVSPCPILYPISYWFACCNPQGPQCVDPSIHMYASVLLSADILPLNRGTKQWGKRNRKRQLPMLTGLSAAALQTELCRPGDPQTALKGFSGR